LINKALVSAFWKIDLSEGNLLLDQIDLIDFSFFISCRIHSFFSFFNIDLFEFLKIVAA